MSTMKKCVITRYDKTIKKPPYETIPIGKVEVEEPENDNLGEKFHTILWYACKEKGYEMRFYTMSEDKNFDYEIVVY